MLLLRRGSIISARFHPPTTILGHSASSLEAKNAQFYWQGEPSRALIQTIRCNSNAAPLTLFALGRGQICPPSKYLCVSVQIHVRVR